MYACIACMHVSIIIYIYVCVCVRPCVFTAHFWYQQPNSWITWWFGPRFVWNCRHTLNSPKKHVGACCGLEHRFFWDRGIDLGCQVGMTPEMLKVNIFTFWRGPWFAMTLDRIRAGLLSLLLILKEAGWLSDCIGSVCHFELEWNRGGHTSGHIGIQPYKPILDPDQEMSNLNMSTISL